MRHSMRSKRMPLLEGGGGLVGKEVRVGEGWGGSRWVLDAGYFALEG